MKIEPEFDFFQIVYKVTDEQQLQYMITSYTVIPNGSILYGVDDGNGKTLYMYAQELSPIKDMVKSL